MPATFTVTSLGDNTNALDGLVTLREAVLAANTAAGADTITFASNVSGTINAVNGEILISDAVNIQGPGATTLRVSGGGMNRIFHLNATNTTASVSLSGLTLSNGSSGNLLPADGGAILQDNGTLTIQQCEFVSNVATRDGGAIAVANQNLAVLNVRQSTFASNRASRDGAAINFDAVASATIENSTFQGNSSGRLGGAIYIDDDLGNVALRHNTITGNNAGSQGGGVYSQGSEGTLNLVNNIIAQNQSMDAADLTITIGTVASAGNLVGAGRTMTVVNGVNGNQVGVPGVPINAMLGILQNNGGPTRTILPLAGSTAIDKGSNSGLTVDQRGVARPAGQGFDIGAVEISGATPPVMPTTMTGTPVASTSAIIRDDGGPAGVPITGPNAAFVNSLVSMIQTQGASNGVSLMSVADVNNDGQTDIVVSVRGKGNRLTIVGINGLNGQAIFVQQTTIASVPTNTGGGFNVLV